MSFLGKTTFCAIGHAQVCQFCHVIQSGMLNVYHSPTHLFPISAFLVTFCIGFRGCLNCGSLVPFQFPFLDVVIATDATPQLLFCSVFRGSHTLWHLVWLFVQGAYCLARTQGLLNSHCVKWPFRYSVRWMTYIWTIILLKLEYVIRVEQLLSFFLDYIPTHLSVKTDSLSQDECFWETPSSLHSSGWVSILGSTGVGSVEILIYQSISALLHLGKSTCGSLWVECLKLLMDLSG